MHPQVWVEGIVKSAQAVAAVGVLFLALGLGFTVCASHRLRRRPVPKDSAYMDELGRPCTDAEVIGNGVLSSRVDTAYRLQIALRAHRLKALRIASSIVLASTLVMAPLCYDAASRLAPALIRS